MGATLKVVDEHFGTGTAGRRAGVELRLASERVSAREIIRSRVLAEVEELNRREQAQDQTSARFYIIEHGSPEQELNVLGASARRRGAPLDAEAEIMNATAAFSRRRFIMLLDDRQIEDLDETVGLRPESEVVFVHLMPLKGG